MDSSEKMKYSVKRRFIRWMEDNRGLILTVIGLPASFIFDLVMQVSCINKVMGTTYTVSALLQHAPLNLN